MALRFHAAFARISFTRSQAGLGDRLGNERAAEVPVPRAHGRKHRRGQARGQAAAGEHTLRLRHWRDLH